MRPRFLLLLPIVLLAASCQGDVYPDAHWPVMTPEEAGLDPALLDQLQDYLQGRGCIVRHGHVVYTWGEYDRPGDVASAVKPWYSFFLWKAVEAGRLPGPDALASAYAPCLEELNAELGFKDRGIQFAHLATQTSCYGVREAPGTAFDYNDWQMALFVDTLFLGVYGATHDTLDDAVLHPLLTDMLQCEDSPSFMAFGSGNRPGRLSISPRDFCRFGYLFLREGRWKGEQVLSREHVRLLTTSPLPGAFPRTDAEAAEMCPDQRSLGSERIPDDQTGHKGSYSWLWWVNGVDRDGHRNWPDAPLDTYAALGHRNGMRGMAVIPSLDIVFSWNDTVLGDMEEGEVAPLNKAFRLVREAAAPAPMPAQIISDPASRAWLVRNQDADRDGALDPYFLCGPGDPEDFLYRGKRQPDGTRDGEQASIIARMRGTGVNAIYVQAIRSHGGDGDASHNPFVDSDPVKGVDEAILQQWETWFRELDDAGITVFFMVYDDSARVWSTGDDVGAEEQHFLETLAQRFEHHRNWIWCVAEEYGEAYTVARIRSIAAVLWDADKHRHVVAVHKNDSLSFDEFADDAVIGQFAVQCNRATPEELHAEIATAWGKSGGRYNLNMAEAADFGFGDAATEKFWACAMAGAYVMALDWRFDTEDAPSKDDLERCGYLVRFMESARVNTLAPHDELASGDTRYVLANPGFDYVAYAGESESALGLKALPAGQYSLTWLETNTGESVHEDFAQSVTGEARWNCPAGFTGAVAVHARKR